ncbi:MAG: ACT domain-containing protein [Candidatus Avoscillospira sp.]
MKAIITVVGLDRVGIIGELCTVLAGMQINVEDISQTLMRNYFAMILLVDTSGSGKTLDEIALALQEKEPEMGVSLRIQRVDSFRKN